MSDYRNYDYRNPNDPFGNDVRFDPNVRAPNAAWGWIAAAVFLVVVLAVAFGAGHKPGQTGTTTAFNDMTPPAASHMTAPAPSQAPSHMAPMTVQPPAATPSPRATPTPPLAPAPGTPAQQPAAH